MEIVCLFRSNAYMIKIAPFVVIISFCIVKYYPPPPFILKQSCFMLVATHLRSNQTNFQRNWTIDKGDSYFTIESQTLFTQTKKICQSYKYMTPESSDCISVTYPRFRCIFTKMENFYIFPAKKGHTLYSKTPVVFYRL